MLILTRSDYNPTCLGNHLLPPPTYPLFDSTQAQEFKFHISSRNRRWQCALQLLLRPDLYLWCMHWVSLCTRTHVLYHRSWVLLPSYRPCHNCNFHYLCHKCKIQSKEEVEAGGGWLLSLCQVSTQGKYLSLSRQQYLSHQRGHNSGP